MCSRGEQPFIKVAVYVHAREGSRACSRGERRDEVRVGGLTAGVYAENGIFVRMVGVFWRREGIKGR